MIAPLQAPCTPFRSEKHHGESVSPFHAPQWGKKLLVRRRQGTVRLEDPIPLENTFEASPSGSARQAFRDDSREFCRLTRCAPPLSQILRTLGFIDSQYD